MDNGNQQPALQEPPPQPQRHVNPASIYPEATHGIVAEPHAPPVPSPAPENKPLHFSTRSWWIVIAVAVIVIFMIIIAAFFGGYQLAIYQEQNNDTLLPHFNFTKQPCPAGDTPEYGLTNLPAGTNPANTNPICLSPGQQPVALKPVIYLYPTHQEKVNVQLSYPAGFQATSPAYNPQIGWQVLAQPNGTLTNLADGKTYPYLFWEGKPAPLQFDMTKGFVVAGSQTRAFLQTQLTSMGLNQNETSGFIAFWLPKMQGNRYNLIHFAGSEYTDYAKLTVSPEPDSLLRVFMAFEPLQSPVPVSAQSFPAFHRNGFTVVEWGGTELHQ